MLSPTILFDYIFSILDFFYICSVQNDCVSSWPEVNASQKALNWITYAPQMSNMQSMQNLHYHTQHSKAKTQFSKMPILSY